MKKEYKAPMMSIVTVEKEFMIINESKEQGYTHPDAKKNGRGFEDDEETPAAPKNFWDDED